MRDQATRWLIAKAAGQWQQFFLRGASPGDPGTADLTEPFAQSVWVMRAINHVSQPVAAVPLEWSLGDDPFEDPNLAAFFQAPVLGLESYEEFAEAWIGWLKLKGEAFLILDDTWALPYPALAAAGKQLGQLILAPPSAMREIVKDGQILAWEYRDADGKAHLLSRDQVIQTKCWNPYNPHRGLAEYAAAQIAASTDYLAGKYERELSRNNGDQGMVVTTDGGMPSKEQIEQIEASLKRKRQRLQRGEFTDVFLAGGLKVQAPQPQAADANFAAARLQKRHEIFIAFGVPPSLADVKQSYSLGKDSDYRALIINTCVPVAAKMARALGKIGAKLTGKPVTAYCDWDEHPVFQEVRNERTETLGRLCDRGMPVRLASDYLKMDLPRFPGDDVGYLPFSVQPVGTPAPAADATFSETNGADPVQAMLRNLRAAATAPRQLPPVNCTCCTLDDATLKTANPVWAKNMARRRVTIKQFESRFSRVLMEARREILAKLDSAEVKLLVATRSGVAADWMFDLEKFAESFFKGLRTVGTSAVQDAGNAVWEALGKDDPWKVAPAKVQEFLQKRQNRCKDIPADVWERIRATLQERLDAGDSIPKIAEAIRGEFNALERGQARVIAMTETGACYGWAERESQKDAGVAKRRWLTSGNANVRTSHAAAEGQVRGIDEPFNVGGAQLMYPGDQNGPPEEVINCHCLAVAEIGDQQ